MDTTSTAQRPRLLLHIGTHKTGTSGLQLTLDAHRELLMSRGVCWADTRRAPRPELPKHGSVYRAAAGTDPAAQAAERSWILRQADQPGVHTVLLSEEGLSEPQAGLVEFFVPLAAKMDIEVICCVRRQDLFLEALFNQFVREPLRREQRPPLLFVRAPATQARLNYHALLSRWAQLPARVHVADFDRIRSSEGLLSWFARVGRLDLSDIEERHENLSPDMRVAVLLSRLNRQGAQYSLATMLDAAFALRARHPGAGSRHFLGSAERLRILADCAAHNRALETDFGVVFADQMPPGEGNYATDAPDAGYVDELLAELSLAAAKRAVNTAPSTPPALRRNR